MSRNSLFDRAAVDALLTEQHGLITHSQAHSCGISRGALYHRLRDKGPWQILLPGVYSSVTGKPTSDQRDLAALLYAGSGSVITGPAAMAAHALYVADFDVIDVLIPARRRRQDVGFARMQRTTRMPITVYRIGRLDYVPPARAVADTVRKLQDIAEIRSTIGAAVQRRDVAIIDLASELNEGPTAGSARFRAVLAETVAGVRSTTEADLRKLIIRAKLPEPLYNAKLYLGEEFIAQPDAYWREYGVAVEIDSRQWHLSPADWERTMARHSRMTAIGLLVLHYPPKRLHEEARAIHAEIRSTLEASHGRQLPNLRIVPAR